MEKVIFHYAIQSEMNEGKTKIIVKKTAPSNQNQFCFSNAQLKNGHNNHTQTTREKKNTNIRDTWEEANKKKIWQCHMALMFAR